MAQTTRDDMRRTVRKLVPLALVFLSVGLSTAIVMPFLSLFLTTEVHAGPLRLTVFLVVAPAASVLVSTLIGRLSDRHPIRRKLLITAALAGCGASATTAVVRDYWILLALTVTASAVASTMFPQSFAYAREVLQQETSVRAPMAMSSLRTVFSIAWVAGPPLAAFILAAGGFVWVYTAAAGMYALAALVGVFLLRDVAPVTVPSVPDPTDLPVADRDASRATIWLTAAGFTLTQCAGNLGVQGMPMFVTQDLNGSLEDVGLILGLCAALEIPLMLGFGALSTRVPLRRLILFGAGLGVAYFALVTASTGVWQLAVGQVLNASLIAVVGGLGVTYVQDMLPTQPGRAATVFSNAFPTGAILAGPVLGASQHFGPRSAYGAATVLCLVGLALLASARRAGLERTSRADVGGSRTASR
jgi:SET family sugar efflux transporter-like MFS transporter